jgi:hypothetical protein
MDRIEMNVITGDRQVIELTAAEVAQAQAQYAQWQADEAKRKAELPAVIAKQIADLQAELDAIKGA